MIFDKHTLDATCTIVCIYVEFPICILFAGIDRVFWKFQQPGTTRDQWVQDCVSNMRYSRLYRCIHNIFNTIHRCIRPGRWVMQPPFLFFQPAQAVAPGSAHKVSWRQTHSGQGLETIWNLQTCKDPTSAVLGTDRTQFQILPRWIQKTRDWPKSWSQRVSLGSRCCGMLARSGDLLMKEQKLHQ